MLNAMYILDPQFHSRIYGPEEQAFLSERAEILSPPLSAEDAVQFPELLKQVDVIFSGWGAPVLNPSFLCLCPRLKAFFYGAGSVRNVITEHFWNHEIVLVNAAAANAESVAEYTLSQILFSLKHGWRYSQQLHRSRIYPCHGDLMPPGNYKTTIGLISLGVIGRRVAQLLRLFNHRVLGCDPYLEADSFQQIGVIPTDMDTLFKESDVVSLHAPRLPETRGMIQGHHFEIMKPGATFINTARGVIVREQEMIEVLRRRPDLTAVLDVVFPEPPDPDSPLFSLPNVTLTPHIAGALGNECRRLGQLICTEFDRFISGAPLQHRIQRAQLERMA